MKFLLFACLIALSLAGEYKEPKTEKNDECPSPFGWNSIAKRCQRKIQSGNTQFIPTKCCTDKIKAIEKKIEKKVEVKYVKAAAKYDPETMPAYLCMASYPAVLGWCEETHPTDNNCFGKVRDALKDCAKETEAPAVVEETPEEEEEAPESAYESVSEDEKLELEAKEEAEHELNKEVKAEEVRKQAAKEEEEKEVEESGHEVAETENVYETQESEYDSASTGGCMKKCYYRKYEGAPKRQINCAKLHKYKGRRDCFKGGKKVRCSKLRCKLVHEVEVEKKEVKCRRVCYYRAYPGSRIKKRIPCRDVDTKYVGDKKCAINGKATPCRKLTCGTN